MPKRLKKHTWALKLYFSLTVCTAAFIILQLPFQKELSFVSAIVLLLFYPSRYLDKNNKSYLDHLKILLVIFIGINTFFDVYLFFLIVLLLFFFWFINEGLYYFSFNLKFNKKYIPQDILDDEPKKPSYSNLSVFADYVFIISIVLFIVGNILKLLNWPFADIQILLGALGLMISIWAKKF